MKKVILSTSGEKIVCVVVLEPNAQETRDFDKVYGALEKTIAYLEAYHDDFEANGVIFENNQLTWSQLVTEVRMRLERFSDNRVTNAIATGDKNESN